MELYTEAYAQDAELDDNAVAIIGMAGRFPGADNVEEFWQLLAQGQAGIRHFSLEELMQQGVPAALLQQPNYVRAAAALKDPAGFDAAFFEMTQREAEITDPQHRLLLECAYDALEHAGYALEQVPGVVSVYAGVGMNTYLISNLMTNPQVLQSMGMHQLLLGNDKCYATSRIGYKLNLHGPAISVDTACSTSLVAIVTGYKSLLAYDCDLVLAGAAKVNAADLGYLYEAGGINSPDGYCRTFDAAAAGTVFGSGAGMVVLKRLQDARADKDQILGIIRGAAINNDGSEKVGFTAPSVSYQADVIKSALAFAAVDPATVSYVESHGTGTRLGDPVELSALSEAFAGVAAGSVLIGSVKPNVGHLESAAGVTSLIKVLKAFEQQQLPASLHYQQPNPAIQFGQNPFRVVTELSAWPRSTQPRRACVSSFGLGGTNAHLVLEEPPLLTRVQDTAVDQPELVLLSAKTASALQQAFLRLQHMLATGVSAEQLKDMAYTSTVARRHYAHRSSVVISSAMSGQQAAVMGPAEQVGRPGKIALVMPGQGSQYPGMSAVLAERFSVFATALQQACQAFAQVQPDLPLWSLLCCRQPTAAEQQQMMQTEIAQAAIFSHGYAMAALLASFGVRADLLYGHSLGEYLAVCLSGALSLPAAAELVTRRAQLMAQAPAGGMLAIAATVAQVQPWLQQLQLDLAAINTPSQLVVAGPLPALQQLATELTTAGIKHHQLKTSHAFHSRLMQQVQPAFAAVVQQVRFSQPHTRLISSITGQALTDVLLCQPDYWSSQLTRPVNFAAGCQLLASQAQLVIDLGPSGDMAALVSANLGSQCQVVSLSPHARQQLPADQCFLQGLGRLWALGAEPDLQPLYQQRDCYRSSLPGYAYDKVRCWIDAPTAVGSPQLPAQTPQTPQTQSAASPTPQSSAEPGTVGQQLQQIWAELLGRTVIAPTDNFFELGGQSLLATRMLARIQEQLGVTVSMEQFFDAPSLAALTDQIMTAQLLDMHDADELQALLAELATDETA